MRKTWCSSKTDSTRLVELLRLVERRAERLLDDDADLGVLLASSRPCSPSLLDDHREERRARSRGRSAVQRLARPRRRTRRAACDEALVDVVVVERARARSARRSSSASSTFGSGSRRENCVIASLGLLAELLVGHVAARDADEVEALGQRALVGEVVERRQQLAVGQVARRAEDHQRRRVDRQALEPLRPAGCRGVGGASGSWRAVVCSRPALTAWPPNWLRSAALTFAA